MIARIVLERIQINPTKAFRAQVNMPGFREYTSLGLSQGLDFLTWISGVFHVEGDIGYIMAHGNGFGGRVVNV